MPLLMRLRRAGFSRAAATRSLSASLDTMWAHQRKSGKLSQEVIGDATSFQRLKHIRLSFGSDIQRRKIWNDYVLSSVCFDIFELIYNLIHQTHDMIHLYSLMLRYATPPSVQLASKTFVANPYQSIQKLIVAYPIVAVAFSMFHRCFNCWYHSFLNMLC